jgi:hypothetical protein
MSLMEGFFNLGNKATGGNPIKKAQFDYYLYWIVFLSFAFIALNDFYLFLFKNAGLNTLFWGFIVLIFCWFNYFALAAFKSTYDNMKRLYASTPKPLSPQVESKEVEDMLSEFKDAKTKTPS